MKAKVSSVAEIGKSFTSSSLATIYKSILVPHLVFGDAIFDLLK